MTADHLPTPVQDIAVPENSGLAVLGTARVSRSADAPPTRRIPSFYADPASWAVLEAVDALRAGCPEVTAAPETTATVMVTTHSTLDTMRVIAGGLPGGRVSPLRFAGANAGGPVSLVCMTHGLRGPTLTLTSDGTEGAPAALTMARHWLRTGAADRVVIVAHHHDAALGRHEVRCAAVGAAPDLRPQGARR
ncbi:polyketide synthase [Streptomyces cadmiisoli]|uniref:polyketide synthase n=1 Tax=Streptomyces cadmiisoli TaxID=2184053 RepID=UPI003D71AD78